MKAVFSSRHLGLLATSLLLGFIGVVYALRPGSQPATSAAQVSRLDGLPHFRVISDPVELAQAGPVNGPAIGVVSDSPAQSVLAPDADTADATSADTANRASVGLPLTESLPVTGHQAPASLGISAVAAAARATPATVVLTSETDPAVAELRDLGMAMISGSGDNWFTLQTAFVDGADLDLLKRRIFEASNALGSRDGLFVYQGTRDGRIYHGVCIRKFDSGSSAKSFKSKFDRKLGYATQVRSKKGLQKEIGF